jgi:hypothetical protein
MLNKKVCPLPPGSIDRPKFGGSIPERGFRGLLLLVTFAVGFVALLVVEAEDELAPPAGHPCG